MAANDPTPRAIEDGARMLQRRQARSMTEAAEIALAAAVAAQLGGDRPAGYEIERVTLDVQRPSRIAVKIVWRRADAPRQSPAAGRAAERAARAAALELAASDGGRSSG